MKIAFIGQPRDPVAASPAQRASVPIVLWGLASRLARRHEVLVVAPDWQGEPAEERTAEGVRIVRVRPPLGHLHRLLEVLSELVPGGPPYMARSRYFAGYAPRVAGVLAAFRPDLVHLMSFGQFLPALERVLPDRPPVVLHLHDELLARLDREVASARLARASAVVTASRWLADRLAERFPEAAGRIAAIGNGVDLERFAPTAHARPEAAGERLLFVGRISPEKGVHVLVEAFARLAPARPGLELELVGVPGLMPRSFLERLERTPALEAALAFYGRDPLDRLRRQVLEGGRGYLEALLGAMPQALRARVHVTAPLPHDALVERYRAADLLVAPSVCNEGFGLPVAEAMATGLPCVTTRLGAPPELIGARPEDGVGEAGLAVPAGDPDELAGAIAALLDDPDRRLAMGRAARARAERLLGWEAVVARLEAVYRSVLAGRGSPG